MCEDFDASWERCLCTFVNLCETFALIGFMLHQFELAYFV